MSCCSLHAPSQPTADGDYINGLGLCVDSSGAPLDVLFRCPGHERFVTSSLDQLPQGLLEAYQLFDNSPAIGVGVLPELLYSDDALQSLGHLDIMLRDRVTSDRPLQADPGAYRFIPSLEIMARGKLVLYGNYWVYSGDIPAGATLSVSAGSNATFGDAPSLGANSTVVVENDGARVWGGVRHAFLTSFFKAFSTFCRERRCSREGVAFSCSPGARSWPIRASKWEEGLRLGWTTVPFRCRASNYPRAQHSTLVLANPLQSSARCALEVSLRFAWLRLRASAAT